MPLTTVQQGAPYTWMIQADGNGNPSSAAATTAGGGSVPISNGVSLVQIGGWDGGSSVVSLRSAVADNIASVNTLLAATGLFNGTTNSVDRQREINIFKTITLTASGTASLWITNSGKKFRLMKLLIIVTGNAAAAAAGLLEIILLDGGTAIGLGVSVFIPAAAGTVFSPEFNSGWIDLQNGVLSSAANNILQVNLSFALTAGEVRIIAVGGEE